MGRVGDGLEIGDSQWSFRGKVVEEFDNHVSKSVPFYHEGHNLIFQLSDFFVNGSSFVYDLGCSTGHIASRLARRHINKEGAKFIGIDVEQDMIEKAKSMKDNSSLPNLEFQCNSILETDLNISDFIISYYTIQFIRPAYRQLVFDKIYNSLNWGGGFILYEKVRAPDARFQDITTQIYNDFKVENGYTTDEIMGKAKSLKGILEPFSTKGNIEMLQRSGFSDIMTIQKYVSFEGFLAIK